MIVIFMQNSYWVSLRLNTLDVTQLKLGFFCYHTVYRLTTCQRYIVHSQYKTAKPLLYTVYRTRNWKQLGRKWSGKDTSFEVVPKKVSVEAEVMSGSRPFHSWLSARAVPNRRSLLFGQIRIIKTIIRPNTNIMRIVTLNFEAMSLSFVIVNINIIILDMHSCSTS